MVEIDPNKYNSPERGEYIKKNDLRFLYFDCLKSLSDIADIFSCSIYKVSEDMKYHGIERRDKSKKTKTYYKDSVLTEEFLESEYCWSGNNKSINHIAEEVGFNPKTVYEQISKFNIEKFDIPKKKVVSLYEDQRKSLKETANELDVSVTVLLDKMDCYNIQTRSKSEACSGENHYLYGKSLSEERKRKQSEKMEKVWEESPNRFSGVFESPSEEAKENMRKSAIERTKRCGTPVSYNSEACDIIEEYGLDNGYCFKHAENGGEVQIGRYFVDGFDSNKNVVVEYMEEHHKYRSDYDKERRENIIRKTGCKYIELWYDGEIREYN